MDRSRWSEGQRLGDSMSPDRLPFWYLPEGDLKNDLLYDYYRVMRDIAELEDPED